MKWIARVGAVAVILPVVLTLVVAGIGAAIGLQIMGEAAADMWDGENTTSEYNATVDAIDGVSNITGKFPLIGLAIAMGIIISVLLGFLAVKMFRR